MTTAATNPHPSETFFAKVWDFFKGLFDKAETEAQILSKDIAKYGNVIANELKNGKLVPLLEGALQTTATAINPALGSLVSGLELQLPKLIDKITGVAAAAGVETTKTPAEQEADLATYLQGLKGISGTAYANAIGGISAVVQEYATMNTGTIVADPAHLIVSSQVIHANET